MRCSSFILLATLILSNSRSGAVPVIAPTNGQFYIDTGQPAEIRVNVPEDRKIDGKVFLLLQNTRGELLWSKEQNAGEEMHRFQFETNRINPGIHQLVAKIGTSSETAVELEKRSFVIADPSDVFAVYDDPPIVRGIEWNRDQATTLTKIEIGEQSVPALVAKQGSGETGWGRMLLFRISDPRFSQGGRPVSDVQVEYRQEANSFVYLNADTAAGEKTIGKGPGRNPRLNVLKCELEDAWFGKRLSPGGETIGSDLKLSSSNGELAVRSIYIRGYSLEKEVDWKRLIRLSDLKTTRKIYLYAPDENEKFIFPISNLAKKPIRMRYRLTLSNFQKVELDQAEGEFDLGGGAKHEISYETGTRGWRNGIYCLTVDLKEASQNLPILNRSVRFGIADRTPLQRAVPGEFLYGIDVIVGRAYDREELMLWGDWMGADITRDIGEPPSEMEKIGQALDILDRYHLKSMYNYGPLWNDDPVKRNDQVKQTAIDLEKLAARYKDRITFYELGNEPDLPGFYPGPIEEYIQGYSTFYDAVKRGNPDAIVMSGGLCFSGKVATERANEFLRKVDPARIDAWAYHGHGTGAGAEREAYERMVNAVKKAGQPLDRPFIETESGVSAVTSEQEIEQARTVIQKMTYAQSIGLPVFFFFRIHIGGGAAGYTMVQNYREPRPSILAYRAMVQSLRGHQLKSALPLSHSQSTAYYFQRKDGCSHACVFWTNDGSTLSESIHLGPGATNPMVTDIQGNREPAVVLTDGTAVIMTSRDPVFLTWQTATPLEKVELARSLVTLPDTVQATTGKPTSAEATIYNPGAKPLSAELTSEVRGTSGVVLVRASESVSVNPGKEVKVPIELRVDQPEQMLVWPDIWNVFVHVNEKAFNPGDFKDPPATLPGVTGQDIPVHPMVMRNHTLDFESIAGEPSEQAVAIAFANLESPRDQVVQLAASADWWMAVYVNGSLLYDTLGAGNGGPQSLKAHTFEVHLRKGHNLLTFLVRSGKHGWKLLAGGPDQIRQADHGISSGATQLVTQLRNGKHVLGMASTAVELAPEWATLGTPFWETDDSTIMNVPATVRFSSGGLRNFHEQFPDASRWFKGEEDCSADAWIARDPSRVYILVRVRDNEDAPGYSKESDALQLAVAEGPTIATATITHDADGFRVLDSAHSIQDLKVMGTRGNQTVYRVSFARSTNAALAINLRVLDNDGGILKQVLPLRSGWEWEGVMESGKWLLVP